jgi:hypothetical protein
MNQKTSRAIKTSRWWLLMAAFLLPWVVVIGSHNALEIWLPGQIKVDHWRNLSSGSFLLGGIGAAVLFLRCYSASVATRVLAALLAVAGSVWFAFMFQLRSNCGDEATYVGSRADVQVALCE